MELINFATEIKEEVGRAVAEEGKKVKAEKFLWLVEGKRVLGYARLRKTRFAGDVVYWIRPSERGKGYGKLILRLTLAEAKNRG